jgi:hypothetical protein
MAWLTRHSYILMSEVSETSGLPEKHTSEPFRMFAQGVMLGEKGSNEACDDDVGWNLRWTSGSMENDCTT